MKTIQDKERYRTWSETQPHLPIFLQPWWMDAVCAGKEWNAMLFETDHIVAAVPYLIRRGLGIRYIEMPEQTLLGGIYLTPDCESGLFVDIAQAFSKQLEQMHIAYYQQFFPLDSPMPLSLRLLSPKWKTKVKYHQDPSCPTPQGSSLHIVNGVTAEQFYAFHTACVEAQRKKVSFSREFFLVIAQKTRRLNQSQIIAVADADSRICAAVFVVWDNETLYYLIPTCHPDYKDTDAYALLVHEVTRLAQEKNIGLNFVGKTATFFSVQRYYKWWFRIVLWWNMLRNWKKS